MGRQQAILERWFARTAAGGAGTLRFPATEPDRFRNPVGHLLKENLAVLLQEVLGEPDPVRSRAALFAILRLRALQDVTAGEAVTFLELLPPIVAECLPDLEASLLESKIAQLAVMAMEEYRRCRAQLDEIRLQERRRAIAVPVFMNQARS